MRTNISDTENAIVIVDLGYRCCKNSQVPGSIDAPSMPRIRTMTLELSGRVSKNRHHRSSEASFS